MLFEELIETVNKEYLLQKKAVIHKVPTEWKPLRAGKKIISAKVVKKASVDFLGHININRKALPLVFDVKETKEDKFYLIRIEDHQYQYLKNSYETGAYSFIIIFFKNVNKYYVLPFTELKIKWEAWKNKTGPASIKPTTQGLIKVDINDYLNFLEHGGYSGFYNDR